MKKNITLILATLLLTACSQKSVEPKVETAKTPSTAVVKELSKEPLKEATTHTSVEANVETSSEFVPEHIRRSNIEVVPH